jgi:DNA mismatch repair protein MutS
MYDLYLKLYKEYAPQYGPNTLIFLMVGKFYELYDLVDPATGEGQTSVRRAADLLNIQLTRRPQDGPNKEDGLFGGVPVDSVQKYAQVLYRENWTTIKVDQVKDAAGNVIDRKVSRILSPGTDVDSASEWGCSVAAIWLVGRPVAPPQYAITVFETTTGEAMSAEGTATGRAEDWCCDELLHILQVTAPREVVVFWRGGATETQPDEHILRSRLGLRSHVLYIRSATPEQQGALESPHHRAEYLAALTHIPSMLPIHTLLHLPTDSTSLLERSLCCVLRYIEDHFPSAKQQITRHSIYKTSTTVHLGNNILEQINFIRGTQPSSNSTAQQRVVLSLFERAALTSMGRRSLRARLLNPSSDCAHIRGRLQEVEFFHERLQKSSADGGAVAAAAQRTQRAQLIQETQRLLRGIYDIQRLHHAIAIGKVDASQILQMEQSYEMLQTLATLYEHTPFAQPTELRQHVRSYLAEFSSRFSAQKAALSLKGEFVSPLTDSACAKVTALEEEAAAHMKAWRATLKSFLFWAQQPPESLRMEKKEEDWILRGSRGVLVAIQKRCETVKDSPFTQVQANIKKSVANTLTCDELDTLNSSLAALRVKHSAAYEEACAEVCIPLWTRLLEFQSSWFEWIQRIDESLALAMVALEHHFTKPTLLDSIDHSCFSFQDLFHPLLMSSQTRLEYVKHSVSLADSGGPQGMLLYGVNASGKSSLMKSIGIAIVLAQAGSFVPASSAILSPFTSIYSRIWSQDNLWAGLSSFAVEMTELRDIVRGCGPNSLVLGDEVCSGTESQSATALVGAVLQWLLDRKSCFLFATHLHDLLRLPVLESKGIQVAHLRVATDAAGRLVYERTLRPGPGSSQYGLEVARAMDMPLDLMDAAFANRRLLGGETSVEGAVESSWNTSIVRRVCEVCSHAIVRDLEVHHIQHRAEGGDNSLRNLIVVCQRCHDAHHAGAITIGPLRLTSDGPVRQLSTAEPQPSAPTQPAVRTSEVRRVSKWTEEQQGVIQSTIEQFRAFPIKRILFELNKHGISISAATIRKLL